MDGQHEKIQTYIAYYAWDAILMSKMALAIGKKDEADYYKKIYNTQKQYYVANFVNTDGSLNAESQQSYLHALYLDLLLDENSVKAVTKQLVDYLENKGISLKRLSWVQVYCCLHSQISAGTIWHIPCF